MDDQSQPDQPLFQNTDEQEQVYVPQQMPEDMRSANDADALIDESSASLVTPAAPISTTAPELTMTGAVDHAATQRDADADRRENER